MTPEIPRRVPTRALLPVVLIAATLVVHANSSSGSSSAATPRANGTIVFQRNPGGRENDPRAQIVTRAPDGSLRQLTNGAKGAHNATWSPDGARILFARFLDVNGEREQFATMNADGSDVRVVTTGCSRARRCLGEGYASYLPSGRRVGFMRAVAVKRTQKTVLPGLRSDLMVVGAQGGAARLVRRFTGSAQPGPGSAPRWSPDGRTIALSLTTLKRPVNFRYPGTALHVMPAAGGAPRRITPWALGAGSPDWSPDGTRIVFQSTVGHAPSIYVVGADGRGLTRLLASSVARTGSGPAFGGSPAWSPDGRQIVFVARPRPSTVAQADIYAMNADGTNVHPLVAGPDAEYGPAWGSQR